MISPIFRSLRPKLWIKNFFLFVPLIFSKKKLLCSWENWLTLLAGFAIFCGLSGAVYVLNDIIDIASDRIHPVKCNRPIASGLLSVKEAKAALLLILFICLFAAWNISALFFSLALGYFILNLAYCLKLKKIAIIDVLCFGIGYILRTLAGIGVLKLINIDLQISNSLLIAIFFFAVFLALIKRRQDILITENKAVLRRKEYTFYTIDYIDQITSIIAGLTILFYAIFVLNIEKTTAFTSSNLIYTLPLIIYIILRYLLLIHNDEENELASDLTFKDKPLIASGILWVISIIAINSALI